ncbi:hypothetical protein D3C73_1546780 [compost metagenome]
MRNQTSRANHYVIFYYDTVQQDRSHTDQNAVANDAAVQHDFMAHGDILTHDQWIALRVRC